MSEPARPLPLVLALLLAGAAFAPAAGAGPLGDPWPAGLGGAGPFTRTVVGQFTYDRVPDACVLKGGEAVLAYGPGVYRAYAVVATDVADVARFTRTGAGSVDRILTVGGDGLVAHTLRTTGVSFLAETLDAGWATVVRLRSANVDGVGGQDVVGLDGDGVTFRRLTASTPGGLPDVALPSFVAPHPVTEFEFVQWDLDPALELACLSTVGLEVFDDDGAPLFLEGGAPAGGVLAAFRQADRATERLAWISAASPGSNAVFVVCDASGTEFVDLLAPIGPAGIAAFDVNGDGHDDLAISGTSAQQLLVALNRTDSPGFTQTFTWGPGDFLLLPASDTPSAPAPTAAVAAAPIDLDGDGDLDALLPVDASPELAEIVNTFVDADLQRPDVIELEWEDLGAPGGGGGEPGGGGGGGGGGSQESGGQTQSQSQSHDGDEGLDITGSGRVHVTVDENPNLPADATHLQVIVWRAESYAAATAPVAVQTPAPTPLPADSSGWPMTLTFEIDEPAYPFPAVHYLEIRAIDDGSLGTPARAFPALVGGFAVDLPTIDLLELEEPGGIVRAATWFTQDQQGEEQHPHSSLQIGALVEVPDVDDYVIGTIPVPEAEEEDPPPGE